MPHASEHVVGVVGAGKIEPRLLDCPLGEMNMLIPQPGSENAAVQVECFRAHSLYCSRRDNVRDLSGVDENVKSIIVSQEPRIAEMERVHEWFTFVGGHAFLWRACVEA